MTDSTAARDHLRQLRIDLQKRSEFHANSGDAWWRGVSYAESNIAEEIGQILELLAELERTGD